MELMPIQQSVKLYLGTLISFSTKWVLNSYKKTKKEQLCKLSYLFGIIYFLILMTLHAGRTGAIQRDMAEFIWMIVL